MTDTYDGLGHRWDRRDIFPLMPSEAAEEEMPTKMPMMVAVILFMAVFGNPILYVVCLHFVAR